MPWFYGFMKVKFGFGVIHISGILNDGRVGMGGLSIYPPGAPW
jgi:hypothetical protein